ncbi:MAG: response regulator [Bacteroidia bacterium]|nr:response regulator [Bacteroidia bacterium]
MDELIQQIDIVLIEDNLHDADLIIRTLKKNNVSNKLVHLSDGEDALNFLLSEGPYAYRKNHNKPHIILLDLNLPKLNGIEVLRKIKNDDRTRGIPVIILSVSSDAKNILESYQIGVNGYIIKPLTFADFAKTISDLGYNWMLVNKVHK